MRRLPIYFVIDVSESMVGMPIQQVESGLELVIRELKKDPFALETAHVAIHVFASKAKTLTPLADIISFYPPKFPVGIGTSLGAALKHLSAELDKDIIRTTPDRKGDWKPIVFLFTDGLPQDAYESAIEQWNAKWGKRCTLVAVAFGGQVDTSILLKLTPHVLIFNTASPEAYTAFFKWVSSSIRVSSQSIAGGQGDFKMAPRDNQVVTDIPGAASYSAQVLDLRNATFLGKCSRDGRPYLIKYTESTLPNYRLEGTFALQPTYEELTEPGAERTQQVVSTEYLSGSPVCPCCGNEYGLSKCSCGGILCLNGNEESLSCPWCKKTLKVGPGNDAHFTINKSQG